MITRVHNWDVALVEYAQSILGQQYQWGSMDCGSIVRDAMATIYGVDIFPHIARWENATQAIRTIAEFGTVSQIFVRRGGQNVFPAMAQSGDIMVMPGDHTPFDESVMLVVRDKLINADPLTGIEQLRLADALNTPGAELHCYRMPFTLE